MYHASLWHFEGLYSPGSCFIEAHDTIQGVIKALCEGRYMNRLDDTNDNLPACLFNIKQPPLFWVCDDILL